MKFLVLIISVVYAFAHAEEPKVDRSKWPADLNANLEFYAKMKVIENLSVLESLKDDDVKMAEASESLPEPEVIEEHSE